MGKIDPVGPMFNRAKKVNAAGTVFMCVAFIISLVNITLNTSESIGLTLDIICCISGSLYIICDIITDIIFIAARKNRQTDFIDKSFNSRFAEENSQEYYTNEDVKPGIYRMGVNNFESCFFSYHIALKCLPWQIIKLLVAIILFLIAALCGYNKILLVIATSTVFTAILIQSIKQFVVIAKLGQICESYREFFSNKSHKKQPTRVPLLIKNALYYESIIVWCRLLLSEKVYQKINGKLSGDWERLKNEYNIN